MKLAPWEWMDDSDIFGVQDPDSGEIGWCCIMGGLGQFYALGAYLGTHGLESYLNTAAGKASEEEALFHSRMLMTSFEDRSAVDQEDRKIIKQLGLKLRGRNGWVRFRRHDPGYVPWYLSAGDARRLTVIFQQTWVVANQVVDSPYHLVGGGKGAYLVRVPRKTDGVLSWEDQWVRPDVSVGKPAKRQIVPPPFDEVRAHRIKGRLDRGHAVQEVAVFPLPMPIRDGKERPYFPMVFLVMDQETGLALANELFPMPDFPAPLPELFLTFLEERSTLPKRILVEDAELLDLLKPMAEALGIAIKKERKLRRVAELRNELFMNFMQR
jgi:hypothetical protein